MKFSAILMAAIAAPALAAGVPGPEDIIGFIPGVANVYTQPCMSGDKATRGHIAIKGEQVGCFVSENGQNRIEWLASGRVQKVGNVQVRAPREPVPVYPSSPQFDCARFADAYNRQVCEDIARRERISNVIRMWGG
jgi:hypothetical protein